MHIFPKYFDDFQKLYFCSKECARGGDANLEDVNTKLFRALGVPGALQERQISFCCAWGGPLGAAKACSISNFEGNTCHFLMILLFVSSGFGDPPGGVEISCLGQRTAQGPLPKN